MYQRLTEVEKIDLRRASDDRLLWIWQSMYRYEPSMYGRSDEEGMIVMKELQAQASAVFNNDNPGFGQTWIF